MTSELKAGLEDVGSVGREEAVNRKLEESFRAQQSAQAQIASLQQQAAELEAQLNTLRDSLRSANEEKERLKQTNSELEGIRQDLLNQVTELSDQVEELNAGLYQYQKQAELVELKQEQLERDLEIRSKHIKRLESLLETRKSRVEVDTEEDSKAEDLQRPLEQFKSDMKQIDRRLDESLKKSSTGQMRSQSREDMDSSANLFSAEGHPISPSPIQRMESLIEYDLPEAFLTESKDRRSVDARSRARDRR